MAELCKVEETVSLTVHGDYNLHKGVITRIENQILNIKNKYRIDNTEHSIAGTTEQVKMSISQVVEKS